MKVRVGLNHRPPPCQGGAPPLSYALEMMLSIGYDLKKSMLHAQYDAIRNEYTLPVAEAAEIVERTMVLFKL